MSCGYDHVAGVGYGAVPVTPVQPGCYGPGPGMVSPVGYGRPGAGFALIVVLFILLIIIGASWCPPKPKC